MAGSGGERKFAREGTRTAPKHLAAVATSVDIAKPRIILTVWSSRSNEHTPSEETCIRSVRRRRLARRPRSILQTCLLNSEGYHASSITAVCGCCRMQLLGTRNNPEQRLAHNRSAHHYSGFQLAPSVIVLWTLTILSRAVLPQGRLLLSISLLGLLNPGWSYTLNIFGLERSTASVATLLWAAEPAMILCLAWLFLGERLSRPLRSRGVCNDRRSTGQRAGDGDHPRDAGKARKPWRPFDSDRRFLLRCLCRHRPKSECRSALRRGNSTDGRIVVVAGHMAARSGRRDTDRPVGFPCKRTDQGGAVGFVVLRSGLLALSICSALDAGEHRGQLLQPNTAIGVVGAYFLLGERMTSIQLTGALLILAAVAILLWLLAKIDQNSIAISHN